jgi:hypothetical protein
MTSEARPARTTRTARDLVLSIVVLLVPVVLLVWAYRVLGHETPPSVDATPAYEAARVAHKFDLLTPGGLPSGWRVTVAQYRDGVLRVGLLAPSGAGAQVVETASPVDTVVPAELGTGARADGTVTVQGTAWQRYTGGRARALVLATPGRTVLVAGPASEAELATVAGALR